MSRKVATSLSPSLGPFFRTVCVGGRRMDEFGDESDDLTASREQVALATPERPTGSKVRPVRPAPVRAAGPRVRAGPAGPRARSGPAGPRARSGPARVITRISMQEDRKYFGTVRSTTCICGVVALAQVE